MIFYDDEHEEMFNKLCGKMPYLDGYHLSLAYLLTMDAVLRYHIGALYDVKKYNVPLVKTQMKKIIVTAKTLYSHPKNVSKIYAALHTDLAW